MVNFEICFNSGQSNEFNLTKDNIVQSITINNSNEQYYMDASLQLANLTNVQESNISINTPVKIWIDGSFEFGGYVNRINKAIKGIKTYDLQCIGKTYDLWRFHTSSHTFFSKKYSGYIVSSLVHDFCSGNGIWIIPPDITSETGSYVETINLGNLAIGDCIARLSRFDGYHFFISGNKLQYYTVSETPQFTIKEEDILSMTPIETSDDYLRNVVLVIGSQQYERKTPDTPPSPTNTFYYISSNNRMIAQGFKVPDNLTENKLSSLKIYVNRGVGDNMPNYLEADIRENDSGEPSSSIVASSNTIIWNGTQIANPPNWTPFYSYTPPNLKLDANQIYWMVFSYDGASSDKWWQLYYRLIGESQEKFTEEISMYGDWDYNGLDYGYITHNDIDNKLDFYARPRGWASSSQFSDTVSRRTVDFMISGGGITSDQLTFCVSANILKYISGAIDGMPKYSNYDKYRPRFMIGICDSGAVNKPMMGFEFDLQNKGKRAKYLYTGGEDNRLIKHNASDGSFIWEYTGHSDDVEGVAVSDNGQYVWTASEDGTMHKLNASDGSFIWKYSGCAADWFVSGSEIYYLVEVDVDADDNAYVGGETGKLHKVDKDGNNVWVVTPLSGYSITDIFVDRLRDKVYVIVGQMQAYCYDLDGNQQWVKYIGYYSRKIRTDNRGNWYVGLWGGAENTRGIYKFSGTTVLWQTPYNASQMYLMCPAIDHDYNVVAPGFSYYYKFNGEDGSVIYSGSKTNGGFPTSVLADDTKYFYVLNGTDDKVWKISSQTGQEIWASTSGHTADVRCLAAEFEDINLKLVRPFLSVDIDSSSPTNPQYRRGWWQPTGASSYKCEIIGTDFKFYIDNNLKQTWDISDIVLDPNYSFGEGKEHDWNTVRCQLIDTAYSSQGTTENFSEISGSLTWIGLQNLSGSQYIAISDDSGSTWSIKTNRRLLYQIGWNYDYIMGRSTASESNLRKYGSHFYRVNEPLITTPEDARILADRYVDTYSEGIERGSLTIKGRTNIILSSKFRLSGSNLGIDKLLEIASYTQKIDKNGFTTTINYGTEPFDIAKKVANLESEVYG